MFHGNDLMHYPQKLLGWLQVLFCKKNLTFKLFMDYKEYVLFGFIITRRFLCVFMFLYLKQPTPTSTPYCHSCHTPLSNAVGIRLLWGLAVGGGCCGFCSVLFLFAWTVSVPPMGIGTCGWSMHVKSLF